MPGEKKEKIFFKSNDYKDLIDEVSDIVYSMDAQGRILYVNKAGLRLLGYRADEVIGRQTDDFIHSKDRSFVSRSYRENLEKGLKKIKKLQFRLLNSSGKYRWMEIDAKFDFDERGRHVKTWGLGRDITEKILLLKAIEQSKSHYKQVIDTIQDPICVIGRDYRIQSCNIAFARKVNLFIKEIKGLYCSDVLPRFENSLFADHCRRSRSANECGIDKVLRTAKPLTVTERNVIRKGEEHFHSIRIFPAKDKKGKVDKAVLVIRNVTERMRDKKKIEDLNYDLEKKITDRTYELHKTNKELAKILDLQSKFISDASHELRTPLTIMQGNLDLAASEARMKSECPDEIFEVLNKEVKHMSNVLGDLTMITKADMESEKINKELIDVDLMLSDVKRSLDILAAKRNIKITKRKTAKNILMMADEIKLERVFLNIVRNAIKYTGSGGQIEIWAQKDKKEIRIFIKDNGIGIPAEDLPFIFERFYRVDKARSRKAGGTGLGLSISKLIVKAHGGNISVLSNPSKGSTFVVHLPLGKEKITSQNKLI